MDNNAFVELANREIAKREWWVEAREIIQALGTAQRDQQKAEQARDAAKAERDKALAEADKVRAQAKQDAEAVLNGLTNKLAVGQAKIDAAAAKAAAELATLQKRIDQARVLAVQAEDDTAAVKQRLLTEEAALRERVALLAREKDALEARLAAILK